LVRHYEGTTGVRGSQPSLIQSVSRSRRTDPRFYRADPGLASAVNVALLLGQPLLVTGEPGTGKTQLADSVSWELGYGAKALRFDTKSTSMARDLFYTYDAIRRFHLANRHDTDINEIDFIHYNALGQAILLANPRERYERLFPADFIHAGPRRSVVLIDEIDKAPRDFPNDLLSEIEEWTFRIPEMANALVEAPESLRPVLIATSNSEKNLPDAFLRRCVYYHIEFPKADRLKEIVLLRIGGFEERHHAALDDALSLFDNFRNDAGLRLSKKPATAELVGWIDALHGAGVDFTKSLKGQRPQVEETLGSLVKVAADQKLASEIITKWMA
jgi:MoxR-like ATPase